MRQIQQQLRKVLLTSEQMAGQAQMRKGLIQEFTLNNTLKKVTGTNKPVEKIAKIEAPKKKSDTIEIALDDDSFGRY